MTSSPTVTEGNAPVESSGPVAVIGSGVAGLSAALALCNAGAAVAVFDKGRRIGGRCATRIQGPHQFDHGAQYATARTQAFQSVMRDAAARGLVERWAPPTLDADGVIGCPQHDHWIGTPTMNTLPQALLSDPVSDPKAGSGSERPANAVPTVTQGFEVADISGAPGSWTVRSTGGDVRGPFKAVVIAAPAPQTRRLAAGLVDGVERLDEVVMAPCWTGMFAFAATSPGPDRADRATFAAARDVSDEVAWMALQSSRPQHEGGSTQGTASVEGQAARWVVHAAPEWSRTHLEDDRESIAPRLLALCRDSAIDTVAAEFRREPVYCSAHRWRFAQVERAVGAPCLLDINTGIALAGDWCLGPRIEAAFESGTAAGRAVADWVGAA